MAPNSAFNARVSPWFRPVGSNVHENVPRNRFHLTALPERTSCEPEVDMHDADTYRRYAADCRRIAATMSAGDKAILLRMAQVWDERAEEVAKRPGPQGTAQSHDGRGNL
jgi:hypothetical protein